MGANSLIMNPHAMWTMAAACTRLAPRYTSIALQHVSTYPSERYQVCRALVTVPHMSNTAIHSQSSTCSFCMMNNLTKNRNQAKNVTVARQSANVVYANAASFWGFSKFDVWPGGGSARGRFKSITAIVFDSIACRIERDSERGMAGRAASRSDECLGKAGHKDAQKDAAFLPCGLPIGVCRVYVEMVRK